MTPLMMTYSSTLTVNNATDEGVEIDFSLNIISLYWLIFFFNLKLPSLRILFTHFHGFFHCLKFIPFTVSFRANKKDTHQSLGSPVDISLSQLGYFFLFGLKRCSSWVDSYRFRAIVCSRTEFILITSSVSHLLFRFGSKSAMKHFLWKNHPWFIEHCHHQMEMHISCSDSNLYRFLFSFSFSFAVDFLFSNHTSKVFWIKLQWITMTMKRFHSNSKCKTN